MLLRLTNHTLYTDIDRYCCRWMESLIRAGILPPGDVVCIPIQEIKPHELDPYTQVHFFAGIGGWALALKLAQWPQDRQIWTGSCPCQPFSVAGKRKGNADSRHLWPDFHRLIRERRPAIAIGEQVAGKDGRAWLSVVRADLEALGYGCGAADLCAAGVGAPHRRQRLYWVADSAIVGYDGRGAGEAVGRTGESERFRDAGRLADSTRGRRRIKRDATFPADRGYDDGSSTIDFVGESTNAGSQKRTIKAENTRQECSTTKRASSVGRMGDDESNGRIGRQNDADGGRRERTPGLAGEIERLADAYGGDSGAKREQRSGQFGFESQDRGSLSMACGPVNGFWRDAYWVLTRPQRVGDRIGIRPIAPGTFPLAHGIPGRVPALRAIGNAIVPGLAAEFIRAYMGARGIDPQPIRQIRSPLVEALGH